MSQASSYSQVEAEARNVLWERSLYESLSAEIEKDTQMITTMVNMIQRYRQDIKNVLEGIASDTFFPANKNVQAHIYGSVATELALPESDMDIVITGINSYGNKQTHETNISMLFENIKEQFDSSLMPKSQKILNTKVPIIKLTFNLSEYYDTFTKNGNKSLPYVNFDSIDSINPHLKELSVDISIWDSFNSSEHLGLLQSKFVRDKLEEYPALRPVCLMLKKLLVKHDFNNPYTGGLGSFSLFLMLYSALYLEKMNSVETFQSESTYIARLFAWFLSYYGEYFNIENDVIMFLDENVPITLKKQYIGIEASPVLYVFDPTNSKNNTTQKAFRIEDIQKMFSETKNKITSEYHKLFQDGGATSKKDMLNKIL